MFFSVKTITVRLACMLCWALLLAAHAMVFPAFHLNAFVAMAAVSAVTPTHLVQSLSVHGLSTQPSQPSPLSEPLQQRLTQLAPSSSGTASPSSRGVSEEAPVIPLNPLPESSSFSTATSNAGETIRGSFVAQQRSVIGASMSGRIVTFDWQPGDVVLKGDLLVAFDCRAQEAEANVRSWETKLAQFELQTQQTLLQMEAASDIEVQRSAMNLSRAEANEALASINIANCRIDAPFDAVVVQTYARSHEWHTIGSRLIDITSRAPPLVRLLLPANLFTAVHVGSSFTITVSELNNLSIVGIVDRVVPRIDPLTQFFEAYGNVVDPQVDPQQRSSPPPPLRIVEGMSGIVVFDDLDP